MSRWSNRQQGLAMVGMGVLVLGLGITLQIEHRRRLGAEHQLTQTIEAQQRVEARLLMEQRRSQAFAAALDRRADEVEQLVKRLEENAGTAEFLQGRLSQMESQISQLQAELVLGMRDRGERTQRARRQRRDQAVQLEKITVSRLGPGTVDGKVLQVDTEWQFVVIDLGWDALAFGDVLGVYRGDEFIAKIKVERVQEVVAAARILPEYRTAEVAVDDRIAQL